MREGMSHEEFENYLTLLSRMLQLRSDQSEAIAEELRLHLEERLDELMDRGVDPKNAVNIALGEFGDATALANKFTEISRMKRRRVMMRSMVGGLCVAVAILAVTMTVWPEGRTNLMGIAHAEPAAMEPDDNPLGMSQSDQDNQGTREKLKQKIDADFVERPLNEVLLDFEKQVGVQCRLNVRSLNEIALSSDTPITFQAKSMPAEMVLRLIFEPLYLSYFLDNGFVMVTNKEELQQKLLSVRMYDVKSLVGECGYVKVGGLDGKEMYKAAPTVSSGGGRDEDGGMARKVVAVAGWKLNDEPNGKILTGMIQQAVEPNSWQSVGGHGTMSVYRGILTVRQTESVHEEIGKLLDQLRDKLRELPSPPFGSTAPQLTPPLIAAGESA